MPYTDESLQLRSLALAELPAASGTLDPVDAAIAGELQKDGRASVQALADRLGLSRSSVSVRLRRLIDSHVVRIVGIVHGSVAGLTTLAHVSIDICGRVDDVAEFLSARDAASFVSAVAGAHSMVVELRVRDDHALERELELIRGIPEVTSVSVVRRAELVKDAYAAKRELEPVPLDEVDIELLAELQSNGRATYSELAARVGLSQNAVRSRVIRLVESGTIHICGLVDSSALGLREHAGIGLRTSRPAHEVARRIADVPGVVYVLTGFGTFDVVAAIDAPSRTALAEIIDEIRATNGIAALESWHHLRIYKEQYTVDVSAIPLGPERPSPGRSSATTGKRPAR